MNTASSPEGGGAPAPCMTFLGRVLGAYKNHNASLWIPPRRCMHARVVACMHRRAVDPEASGSDPRRALWCGGFVTGYWGRG